MKIVFFALILSISISRSFASTDDRIIYEQQTGNLKLAVNAKGKIVKLEDISRNINYASSKENSSLISCYLYSADHTAMVPLTARVNKKTKASAIIELLYTNNIKISVEIVTKDAYFQMRLIDVNPVKQISHICWGPYYTSMQGRIGGWLGLNRSEDFTIGMMGLEPNTDGLSSCPILLLIQTTGLPSSYSLLTIHVEDLSRLKMIQTLPCEKRYQYRD
ncbi:hypothetical protein [Pedobacter sp. NJ-S-72]